MSGVCRLRPGLFNVERMPRRGRSFGPMPRRFFMPMTKRFLFSSFLFAALCVGLMAPHGVSSAADAAAGRTKAQMCSVCHGAIGISTVPDAPHLAGQPEIYLSNQLRAYRSGERRHEVMAVIAKPLSDDDIANLAAWFSSVRIEAKPPN
jgi:cytochrome c553